MSVSMRTVYVSYCTENVYLTKKSFFQSISNDSSKITDLKLITVYPRSLSSMIHEMDGQTELLVTDTNHNAINAIRQGIGMANSLQYITKGSKKKRKGIAGILLGISNYISSKMSGVDNNKEGAAGEVIY